MFLHIYTHKNTYVYMYRGIQIYPSMISVFLCLTRTSALTPRATKLTCATIHTAPAARIVANLKASAPSDNFYSGNSPPAGALEAICTYISTNDYF